MYYRNYYLYTQNGTYLTAVRAHIQATDKEIIEHELNNIRLCPGIYGNSVTTPGEFMHKVKHAVVRR